MTKLYGRMMDTHKTGARETTRTAHREIESKLETWESKITTTLQADGTFTVRVGDKYGYGDVVLTGNINERSEMAA